MIHFDKNSEALCGDESVSLDTIITSSKRLVSCEACKRRLGIRTPVPLSTERFWYFDRIGPTGGTFDRYGPFRSNSNAQWARDRAKTFLHYHVGDVYSSKERYPGNAPSWLRKPENA